MSRLLVLAACLACIVLAGAADWPQYRGPNRDNVSPDRGLLKSWPKKGPKLAWKSQSVGQGFSSMTVVGDRVYTMGNRMGTAYLFALDRKNGKVAWEAKVGDAGTGGRPSYPGTRCTPPCDGEFVFGLGPVGDLVCVEAGKGKEVWRKNLRDDYQGEQRGPWEYAESPLIDGDRLICTPGGNVATLVALDRKSGSEIWKAPLGDRAGYASVVISDAGGIKQYVALTDGGVIGVRASDGKLLWRYKTMGNNTANIPTPIVKGDQVFAVAGYSKGAALLTLRKEGDGIAFKEEYYNREFKNKHGGVVIVGDYVYGDSNDNGGVICLNWRTGKEMWRRGQVGQGRTSASLTAADGNLYLHYANGYMALVPASPKGYSEKGSFKIPNSTANSWSHPVVIDGRLYVRDRETVWCYVVK
jgi:outer membrane protein assembly factor BamB